MKYKKLISLMQENMGNKNIDDHALIDIVDLLEELEI